MFRFIQISVASLLAVSILTGSVRAGWDLTWTDEFSAPDGSAPDPAKWVHDLGGGGWGNNELQSYTDRRVNSRIEGGRLIIEARKETYTGTDGITRNYTSARLKTKGKADWTFGRIESRIRIPRGQGLWPAFWMLGRNFDSVGWPGCGEIDIMENIGKEPSTIHGALHGPGYSGGSAVTTGYNFPGGTIVADDFHSFAVEWETNRIQWFVDGQLFFSARPSSLPGAAAWVFNAPQFLILNVATGGNWPGNPDASTVFPQQMILEYVRVYKQNRAPDNTLLNPGFEELGFNNWWRYGPNVSLLSGPAVPAQQGTNAVKIFGQFNNAENYSGLFQDTSSAPGVSCQAQGWFFTPAQDRLAGGNSAWLEITFRDTARNVLSLYRSAPITSSSPPETWLELAVTNRFHPQTQQPLGSTNRLFAPPGTAFVRAQVVLRQTAGNDPGSVYADNFSLSQTFPAVPPVISSVSPDGSVPFVSTNHLQFQVVSPDAPVPAAHIRTWLNGVEASARLSLTGNPNHWFASLEPLLANQVYSVLVAATNSADSSASAAWQFDTFRQDNFIIEAEDYDFGSGQFIASPLPASSTATNSYFGRAGTQGIDRNETSFDGERLYRSPDPVATLVADDFWRDQFAARVAAGDTAVRDYKVGYFYPGEWLNYTRRIPQGDYVAYARLSGGSGAAQLHLDRVTAGRGTTSQQVQRLGTFAFTGTGWQSFQFVPIRDGSGNPAVFQFDGLTTLRLSSAGGADPNFLMLVPVRLPAPRSASREPLGLQFFSYPGVLYEVWHKASIQSQWSLFATLTGNGSEVFVPFSNAPAAFFHLNTR